MAALKTLRWRGDGTLRFAAVDYTETVLSMAGLPTTMPCPGRDWRFEPMQHAMTISYDRSEIMAEAQHWREKAAAASDPAYRDECLRCAAQCEALVRRSVETPLIKEAG